MHSGRWPYMICAAAAASAVDIQDRRGGRMRAKRR